LGLTKSLKYFTQNLARYTQNHLHASPCYLQNNALA